jgi:hypothetical protein
MDSGGEGKEPAPGLELLGPFLECGAQHSYGFFRSIQ